MHGKVKLMVFKLIGFISQYSHKRNKHIFREELIVLYTLACLPDEYFLIEINSK